ncbi:MAG: hypothetical protein IIV91_05400 [Alistipes sp.]|nr:hypothetical protein [Alistipes sp.]
MEFSPRFTGCSFTLNSVVSGNLIRWSAYLFGPQINAPTVDADLNFDTPFSSERPR